MKLSFPTKAEFVDGVKTTSKKVGYFFQKEKDSVMHDPLHYAENVILRYGRAATGFMWLYGDMVIGSSPKLVEKMAGIGCFALSSVMLLAEPLLPKNENGQAMVNIGEYKINTTKAAFGLSGAGCTLIFGSTIENLYESPNFYEALKLSTGVSAYGCFQAARKDLLPEKQLALDKPFGGQLLKDNEFSGMGKFFFENTTVLLGTYHMGQHDLFKGYMMYMIALGLITGRRALELKRKYKELKTEKNKELIAGKDYKETPSID
jgi:hypothetical protein